MVKTKNRNCLIWLLALTIIFTSFGYQTEVKADKMKDTTAKDLVKNIQIGWNLGNTLDSIDGKRSHDPEHTETSWGNIITTKAMLKAVAKQGFQAVRVPVTYYDNCDEEANIDKEWLDRVEEVTNYVLDSGMYCIIDVHHDVGMGAWITADKKDYKTSKKRLKRLWEQIAKRFKDYDERLIFEGFNELINDQNEWENAEDSNYEVTNKLNQVFVDTVRKSGGNNKKRILLVNLYAAIGSEKGVKLFEMPKDSVKDAIIVGFHSYTGNETEFQAICDRMKKKFVDKNIPVIMGEFGTKAEKSEEARAAFAGRIVQTAYKAGIVCFWWDDGGSAKSASKVTTYALLNRKKLKWYFPEILESLMQVSAGGEVPTFKKEELPGAEEASDKIPSGMEKIQSINFKGDQSSIDTKILLDKSCSYRLELGIEDIDSYDDIMQANTNDTAGFGIRQEQKKLFAVYGSNRFEVGSLNTEDIHSVMQLNADTFFDNVFVKDSPTQSFENADLVIGMGKCIFYKMDICADGKLKSHLIPVLNKKDKKPGILDTVSGEIYYPKNTAQIGYTDKKGETKWLESGQEDMSVNDAETKTASDAEVTPTAETDEKKKTEVDKTKMKIEQFDESKIPDDIQKLDSIVIDHPDGKFVTNLELGVKDNYEVLFSLPEEKSYGEIISAVTDDRTCYEVRQEEQNLIVSYGYNRFTAGSQKKDEDCLIVQEDAKTYFNGSLVQSCPVQDFKEGVLTIGACQVKFQAMNIYTSDGYTHQLIPALDENEKVCIYDVLTGEKYYSSDLSHVSYTK